MSLQGVDAVDSLSSHGKTVSTRMMLESSFRALTTRNKVALKAIRPTTHKDDTLFRGSPERR